ncbi:uncharacterized protein LOC125036281 [Penaeus chinensis]|uniref:uncharacterized protein LOC125036281 n=1 Tax=Penaeus chinensis TaxID=139456 RepID=UPI001FB612DC|nr:uncharacterized protein LOC125036281 [Penaeus chinensis]
MASRCSESRFQMWTLKLSFSSLVLLFFAGMFLYDQPLLKATYINSGTHSDYYAAEKHDGLTFLQQTSPNNTQDESSHCNTLLCNHESAEPASIAGMNNHSYEGRSSILKQDIGGRQGNSLENIEGGSLEKAPTRPGGRAGSDSLPHSSPTEDQTLEKKEDEDKVAGDRPPNLLVLFWTPFWDRRDLWAKMIVGRLRESGCPTWSCEFVWAWPEAEQREEDAAAFVFFSRDFYDVPRPPRRPHQLWVWLESEAPPISEASTGVWNRAESEGIFFNLTMSYHRLNDVVMQSGNLVPLTFSGGYPYEPRKLLNTADETFQQYRDYMVGYDRTVKMLDNGPRMRSEHARSNDSNINGSFIHSNGTAGKPEKQDEHPGDRLDKKEQINATYYRNSSEAEAEDLPWHMHYTQEEIAMASRTKLAAWMASHCSTDSRRESVVAALQRHISVTTVGKCGELSCGKNHMDTYCYRWLASSHLFYLSFENARCDDYVTEKLWRPLEHGMVPVVYGGAKYEDFLPFGSFINAAKFQSAKDLARYLAYLGNHPTAYLRYLQWRRFWRVRWPTPWCQLCSRLHQQQSAPSLVTLDSWWNSTATCYDPLMW